MLKCKQIAFMGAVLPNTLEIRKATSSEKLNQTLDCLEGDFLAWKKVEQKLLKNTFIPYDYIIDISSAASMQIFKEGRISENSIHAPDILSRTESYPFVIAKDNKLEETFVQFCKHELDRQITEDEVLIFNGSFSALRTIVLALSGQYVLVPEFMSEAQKSSIVSMGKTIVEVPVFAPGWTLDLEMLKKQISDLKGNISCMYIHHAMPADLTNEYFDELALVLQDAGIIPVIDIDIMKTQHTDKFSPLLPFHNKVLQNSAIFLFTLSKEFGAPGIRIGFGVMPASLREKIRTFQQKSLEMIPPVTRYVAEVILSDYDLANASKVMCGRMDRLVNGLCSLNLEAKHPNIGVNLFMHVPRTFEKSKKVLPDHLFTYYCLTRAGVVLRPGSIYGHRLNHFVRFVICQPEVVIDDMVERLRNAGVSGTMLLPDDLEDEYQAVMSSL